jgi:hypothetical protein
MISFDPQTSGLNLIKSADMEKSMTYILILDPLILKLEFRTESNGRYREFLALSNHG